MSYVNAPLFAQARRRRPPDGRPRSPNCRDLVAVGGVIATGAASLPLGTLAGARKTRKDRRGQRVPDRHRADRAPVVLPLHRPARHRRSGRPRPRRGGRRHRLHAGRAPRRQGWPGADRADGRLRHPRRVLSSSNRDRGGLGPRRRPDLSPAPPGAAAGPSAGLIHGLGFAVPSADAAVAAVDAARHGDPHRRSCVLGQSRLRLGPAVDRRT